MPVLATTKHSRRLLVFILADPLWGTIIFGFLFIHSNVDLTVESWGLMVETFILVPKLHWDTIASKLLLANHTE